MKTTLEDYPLLSRGKVRDMYDLDDTLLIVTTDRISAFDHILPNGIPGKGKVLNQISVFWFDFTEDIVPNHLITANVEDYPEGMRKYAPQIEGRSMLVKKAERIDIECVVRGYLAGSGWREYRKSGTVCGEELVKGLKESDKLPEPIFTPSTKAESGHDENISFAKMKDIVGAELAESLKDYSIQVYSHCADYAREKGIIIADTKFEFGILDDEIILIDEVLTPDSSRFWDLSRYEPGKSQPSYDKQIVRDYLEQTGWDKDSDPPALPENIIAKTTEKYREVLAILTE
jgi:phosphoribosylaminoimidazole-succinocarboxamide synthase